MSEKTALLRKSLSSYRVCFHGVCEANSKLKTAEAVFSTTANSQQPTANSQQPTANYTLLSSVYVN
jgi:hypothetical protein